MKKIAEKKSYIFKKYIKLINQYKKTSNISIFDIGCANGIFLSTINKDQNQCYGVDVDKDAINNCKNNKQLRHHFEVYDLNIISNDTPFKNINFDIITCFDVIEHLTNFSNLEWIIKNNLKREGIFIVTTPNANAIEKIFNKNYPGEYDKSHKILFTPYTLDFLLRRMGLKKIILYTPYIFMFYESNFSKIFPLGGQIFGIYEKLTK